MRRNRIQIVHDILLVVRDKGRPMGPTNIMYKANLSHQMLEEYLEDILSKGLLREETSSKGKLYSLTDNGFQFLSEYSRISAFMESFGMD